MLKKIVLGAVAALVILFAVDAYAALPYSDASVYYQHVDSTCPPGSSVETQEPFSMGYSYLNLKYPQITGSPLIQCHWTGVPFCYWNCYPGGPFPCPQICPHILSCDLSFSWINLELITDFWTETGAMVIDVDGCVLHYQADVTVL